MSARWDAAWEEACRSELFDRIEVLAAPDASSRAPARAMLSRVVESFGLTPFERDIIVTLAAAQLDPGLLGPEPSCCTEGLSFDHALRHLPGAHWSAVSPSAPLRRWRLVQIDPAQPFLGRLQLDEAVLLALLGVRSVEPALERLALPAPLEHDIACTATLLHAARDTASRWLEAGPEGRATPVLQVTGSDAGLRRRLVTHAAGELGLNVWSLSASDLPATPPEIDDLSRAIERAFVLADVLVLVQRDDDEPAGQRAVARLADRVSTPIAVAGESARRVWGRSTVHVEAPQLSDSERSGIWRGVLGLPAAFDPSVVDDLAHDFALPLDQMRDFALQVAGAGYATPQERLQQARISARAAARSTLEGLAQRLTAPAGWDDIVLPDGPLRTLKEIAAHVRQRRMVEQVWGFASRRAENLAVTALFHGPSGVGKTLAARVIASELDLDLYRVDLSQTVSKYIGDTEKNLKLIFDAAEQSGAVLVFDEADALFGKRSEVRDSHDRYANIEVSYLLQRMESYRGLAILTTNLPANLDASFIRRIRYAIGFALPDVASRRAIWRSAFPADAPAMDLDHDALARLSVSGASIANIALGAAVLAADAGSAIGMEHLLRATEAEYAKLERSLSPAELQGWPARLEPAGAAR